MPVESSLERKEETQTKQKRLPKKNRPAKTEFLDSLDSTLSQVYRLLYYFGIKLERFGRHKIRHMELWIKRSRDKAAARRMKKKAERRRKMKEGLHSFLLPFFVVKTHLQQCTDQIKNASISSEFFAALFKMIGSTLHLLLHLVCKILNYAAPLAAVWVLVLTISHFTGFNFALSVTYGGESLGYISDESIFEAAEKQVSQRVVYEDTTPMPAVALEQADDEPRAQTLSAVVRASGETETVIAQPKYKLEVVDKSKLVDADVLADRIIRASGSEIVQASGIYISGEFKGASTEPQQVLELMNGILSQYETGTEGETIQFVNKVKIKDGLYPVQSLRDTGTFDTMLHGNVSGEAYYTVVEGDSPYLIAEKIGLRLSELERMNPEITDNFLPGKKLLVARSVPLMKVQVTRRETFEEDIPFETDTEESSSYIKGYNEITRSGVPGVKRVEADITYLDGVAVSTNIIKETVITEPRNAIRTVGINVPTLGGGGGGTSGGTGAGFIWPVRGGYISMPIWGYSGHTGTDIAASSGTPIYASASGVVSLVRVQYYGYGKHIQINHGNGLSTLYAHCSSLLVSPGQYVNQGDLIALVGRTGNATGNHCHLEIRQNGVPLDARRYIGYSSPY